jgi:hypothetical protein
MNIGLVPATGIPCLYQLLRVKPPFNTVAVGVIQIMKNGDL